ncbi:MAG: polyether ionophore transport system permease protein [Solirubrobacteraceae bacterium]|nr:polyether ionophore transport system permease protein [Solirubrobacteraceae bacterium]
MPPAAGASGALIRLAFRASRTRAIVFGYLFAGIAYATVAGYAAAYPTRAGRLKLSASLGTNHALRLFYGEPHDLLTGGGYAAWRVGGICTILAAAWAMLAAIGVLRGEEDAGRAELVLSGVVGRTGVYVTALTAIGAATAILWTAAFAALAVGGLPVGGSAYLALAIVSVAPVFAGVGAVAGQLASTRRLATQLGAGVLALAFVLRVVADTSPGLGWVRWTTPLGWSEELRAFTGPHPAVLLVLAAAALALLAGAGRLARDRDIGAGLIPARDRAEPRLGLLSSPTAQALRAERGSLVAWVVGTGFFGFVMGTISTSVAGAGLSASTERQLAKIGAVSISTPTGYIGFVFLFFVLAVSLYACSQIAAARAEESAERLETLLALPLGRGRWLTGRLALAAGGAAAIAATAGVSVWAGAATQDAGVPLPRLLEAAGNCMPAGLLFLALAALAYATVPRASVGIGYGLVGLTFVWQLLGDLIGAPGWVLGLSPFAHVRLVPAQAFAAGPALIMLGLAAAGAVAAVHRFGRRDLTA